MEGFILDEIRIGLMEVMPELNTSLLDLNLQWV